MQRLPFVQTQDLNHFGAPAGYNPAMLAAVNTSGIFGQPSLQGRTSLGQEPASTGMQVATVAYGLLSLAGSVSGAYHGYKRNNSVGWAIGWAILGGMFPVITIPLSLAEGYAKPAK